MNCPKCDADISDTFEEGDWSVGIEAGWYCEACDLGVAEWKAPRGPMEGDVEIKPISELYPDRKIGTPISELSSQPGPKDGIGHSDHARYAEFCRIAHSWGYD